MTDTNTTFWSFLAKDNSVDILSDAVDSAGEFVARLFRGEDLLANREKSPASDPSNYLRARDNNQEDVRFHKLAITLTSHN